jgi:hypothetical protein
MLAAIFLASEWHFLDNKHAVLAGCSAFWPVNCIFLHKKTRTRCTAEWPFCYWSLFCASFRAKRNFSLSSFLISSTREITIYIQYIHKTKKNSASRGKFRLVENGLILSWKYSWFSMFAQMSPCLPYLETMAFIAETKVASRKAKIFPNND